MYARQKDSGYSTRRMVYVFATTAFCLIAATALVACGYQGDLVGKFVTGLLDLISTISMLYLGAGVLDRSQILSKVGDGFARRRFIRPEYEDVPAPTTTTTTTTTDPCPPKAG